MGQGIPAISEWAQLVLDASAEPLPRRRLRSLARSYWLAFSALLLLAIGVVTIKVGGNYWSARVISSVSPAQAAKAVAPTITGLNLTVPADQLQTRLQTITNQPATLTVGSQTVPVGADTIKSWLQITLSRDKSEYYVRVKAGVIADSLKKRADQFTKAPIDQVTVSEDGVSRVVVGGRNGIALSDPDSLKAQARQVAKTVMDAKGLQFSTPLVTQPFRAVGPEAFDKLLVASISGKHMWGYQNGQQIKSWPVSAGAPATPTPIGQFKIYAKLRVQDMRGFNPNGTRYFQPHVRWIEYFYEGSAVHGVYWRPRSWFGAVNSSHGCIGLPEDEAQWIFNWSEIGTTVIVHA